MSLDRRTALLGTLALGLAGQATAEPTPMSAPGPGETIDLWPAGAPGAPSSLPVETVKERSTDPAYNDRYVLGIGRPRLVLFRPARPNGAAVMIAPGGGYSWVVIDKEGYELARWLAARGVTAFVLFYRLPHEGWAAGPDTPLQDSQRAMRLIRRRAAAFGIDPKRVCAMGFSAGGHVCADLLARFSALVYSPVDSADRLSARPDLAAPIYPVVSMTLPVAHAGSRRNLVGEAASPERERAHSPHLNIPADAPPAFLLHAEDDPAVPVANTLLLREALLARRVPVETHLFADGGHGFGLRLARGKSVEGWQEIFWAWARKKGLFE
ncbi:MAG: alpha/beta hydrolase [Alphaproteobacteria bacterium]|nr:alpha/beta hydrolase [Alphaproteobacteria bacterium]MBV9372087.1 alpha/beta hydrolase [Alphaproteobacteria bacterium]MBV9901744.1 alpha/beta hydrolase [Alphaproteobacteria bacterium]